MTTPEHNRRPSASKVEAPLNLDDISDLRHPDRNSPLFEQRLLHDTYIRLARESRGDSYDLIAERQRMTDKDFQVFSLLERAMRQQIRSSLPQIGVDPEGSQVSVRAMHHLVAVKKEERQRHLYMEVISKGRNSILATAHCAEQFSRGPSALHIVAPNADENGAFVIGPLISRNAFEESVEHLVRSIRDDEGASPKRNWAIKWVLQALSRNKQFLAIADHSRSSGEHSSDQKDEWDAKIQLVSLSATDVSLKFLFEKAQVEASLGFNEARQQPDVTLRFSTR